MSNSQPVKILSGDDIRRTIQRLTHQILEKNSKVSELGLIGIQTRGVYLARRIQAAIKQIESKEPPLGLLDITLYRDDLARGGFKPVAKETSIEFDINNKEIILVDDVLFTGRTIRAALDEIMDFGRPKRVELLVLIDRGHRELPIRADFVGKNIPTSDNEIVEVKFQEAGGLDEVTLRQKR